MSLSRSPSPQPGGGWASPGLSSPFGEGSGSTTPRTAYRAQGDVTWESAKAKSEGINGYPSFSTHNNGFFNRHYRKISSSLPRFNLASDKSYAEKEKLGRGRWSTRGANRLARLRSLVRRASRKTKIRFLIGMALFALFILYYMTRKATFSNLRALLTSNSRAVLVAQVQGSRRRQEIRYHSGSKPGGRCDGVEGAARMGD